MSHRIEPSRSPGRRNPCTKLTLGAGVLLAVALGGAATAQGAYSPNVPVTGGRILPPGERPPHLGRAGPPGTFVRNIDMAPVCIAALQRAGFMATRVTCPDRLATKPGLTAQCVAGDGRHTASAITTFLDYDPVTGHAATDCYLKSVIGRL